MTVKNFLKTAVLGIAFCSVFGMSNGITAQNIQFQNILNELEVYNHDVLHNLKLMKTLSVSHYEPDLNDFIKNEILEIIDIMERTMNNNVNEQDLTRLVNNIEDLKNTPCYDTRYALDVREILYYSDQIIHEVQNHVPSHIVN